MVYKALWSTFSISLNHFLIPTLTSSPFTMFQQKRLSLPPKSSKSFMFPLSFLLWDLSTWALIFLLLFCLGCLLASFVLTTTAQMSSLRKHYLTITFNYCQATLSHCFALLFHNTHHNVSCVFACLSTHNELWVL